MPFLEISNLEFQFLPTRIMRWLCGILAERVGFEPTEPCGEGGSRKGSHQIFFNPYQRSFLPPRRRAPFPLGLFFNESSRPTAVPLPGFSGLRVDVLGPFPFPAGPAALSDPSFPRGAENASHGESHLVITWISASPSKLDG